MNRRSSLTGLALLGALATVPPLQAAPPEAAPPVPPFLLAMDMPHGSGPNAIAQGMPGPMTHGGQGGQGGRMSGMQPPAQQRGMGGMGECAPGQGDCGRMPGATTQAPGMGMPGSMGMDEMARRRQSRGSMGIGMGPGMGGQPLDHLEGRIAFLHAELRITPQQMPAWDTFAAALRSSRDRLVQAQNALQTGMHSGDVPARLEAYERHEAARVQAIHNSRVAFANLYDKLDEGQKRAAEELVVPFLTSL